MERTTRGGFLKAARMVERTPDSRSAFHNSRSDPPSPRSHGREPTNQGPGLRIRGSRFKVHRDDPRGEPIDVMLEE